MDQLKDTYGDGSSPPDPKVLLKRKAEDEPEAPPAKKIHAEEPLYHFFVCGHEDGITAHRFHLASTPKSAFILQELGKMELPALCATLDFLTNDPEGEAILMLASHRRHVLRYFDRIPPSFRVLSPAERGAWEEIDIAGVTQTCPTTYYNSMF